MIERITLIRLLEERPWTFAKTMPHIPHFWSAKKDWPNPEDFDACAEGIQHYGREERFKNFAPKVYYYANGFRYWTMSEPGVATIINRCDPEHPLLKPHIKVV